MTEGELTEIRDAVKRIEAGMFGDDQLDQPGLISRVKNHNVRIKRLERVSIYVSGAAGAVIVIYHVLIDIGLRHP